MGKIIGEGITFDDVLLVPAYSEVIPNQVDLTTYLTKKSKTEHSDDECRNGYGYRTIVWQLLWQDRVELVLSTKICQLKHRQTK